MIVGIQHVLSLVKSIDQEIFVGANFHISGQIKSPQNKMFQFGMLELQRACLCSSPMEHGDLAPGL